MTIAELFAKLTIKPDKKSFDAADKMIGALKSALLALVAVKTADMFAGMVQDTIDAGSHINDLSQSAGMGADELQVLGYAAKLNSSNMDEMAAGMGKLTKSMMAATQDGSGPTAQAFSRLGVRITDATGKLRPAQDVFEDISINQRKMGNETERNGLLLETMGRSALSLVPTMNDVADKGLAHFSDEAHALGVVMSDDTIAKLDELGDTEDKVKMSLTGLKNEAVAGLLPVLQEMATGLLEWVKANKELIKQKIETIIRVLVAGLKLFAKIVSFVVDLLDFLGKNIKFVGVVVLSLVAALAIFRAASIAAAIASGVAWFLANLPLILLAATIAAVILLVEDLLTAFDGGDSVLKDWLGEDTIADIKHAFEVIKDIATSVADWVYKKFKTLIDLMHDIRDFAENGFSNKTAEQRAYSNQHAEAQISNAMTGGNGSVDVNELSAGETAAAYTRRLTAQHAALAGGGGGTTVQAPVTIQVNGTNLSPDQLGSAITRAMGDFWNTTMKATDSQIGGGK